jgi:NAD(P)H-nitrite reductase large subunit
MANGAPVPETLLDCQAPATATTDHLVCSCQVVSAAEIRTAIAEHDLTTVEAVSERTGAATGCGGCRPDVQALIEA